MKRLVIVTLCLALSGCESQPETPVARRTPKRTTVARKRSLTPAKTERPLPRQKSPTPAKRKKALEHQLAVIDAGTYVRDDDITVARFRSLLGQLDEKFEEEPRQIADMTVHSQNLLKKEGVKESLINIMEGMNKIFYGKHVKQKYAEYIVVYITLRKKGQSHDEAIKGLQAILRSLGVE